MPSRYYRDIYGYFKSHSCSPCAKKCVKPAPIKCPPPCRKPIIDMACAYPWTEAFACLTHQQLIDLLYWAEGFRLFEPSEDRSDYSVLLAAAHFASINHHHRLERDSMLGIQGLSQVRRNRYNYGDGWATSTYGLQYLDLKNHSPRLLYS